MVSSQAKTPEADLKELPPEKGRWSPRSGT